MHGSTVVKPIVDAVALGPGNREANFRRPPKFAVIGGTSYTDEQSSSTAVRERIVAEMGNGRCHSAPPRRSSTPST